MMACATRELKWRSSLYFCKQEDLLCKWCVSGGRELNYFSKGCQFWKGSWQRWLALPTWLNAQHINDLVQSRAGIQHTKTSLKWEQCHLPTFGWHSLFSFGCGLRWIYHIQILFFFFFLRQTWLKNFPSNLKIMFKYKS